MPAVSLYPPVPRGEWSPADPSCGSAPLVYVAASPRSPCATGVCCPAAVLGQGGLAFGCWDSQQVMGPGRADRDGQGRDTSDDRERGVENGGCQLSQQRSLRCPGQQRKSKGVSPWTPCLHEQDWGHTSVNHCPSASVCTEEGGWTYLELNLELVYWKNREKKKLI